jgi:hypothetical protein
VVFLTKTTVLTSILTSEVTDMVPQPQFELGKVPETQSGTWGNLVPHMCKSQQTTSVKHCHGVGIGPLSDISAVKVCTCEITVFACN